MCESYATASRYFADEFARWEFLENRLFARLIGFDARPARMDSDTRRSSFGSEIYDFFDI